MTEDQAIEAIYERWEDRWEALHPDDSSDPDYIPYVFDNEAFDGVASWARVSVVPTQPSRQASMGPPGSRRFDRGGTIAVQLFVASDQGIAGLLTLADEVRDIFEGARIALAGDAGNEPVCTYGGSTTDTRIDGAWQTCTVLVPFRFQETR